jgi:hypothetical protein
MHVDSFFLARSVVTPPVDLQRLVFPRVENWQEKFQLGGDDIQSDIAGPNFLMLLSELRIVFLQVNQL